MRSESSDVIVVGAGPVGLAAAAHLLEHGLRPLVLEAGPTAAAAVTSWGHVRLFSPWRLDVDAAARRLLAATGWVEPAPDDLPTGTELVERYLAPLAAHPALAPLVRTGVRVTGVSRTTHDKTRGLGRERALYRVRTVDADGRVEDLLARAVVDASGTCSTPNPIGAGGLPAVGEADSAAFVTGALPDVLGRHRDRFAGRRTLVVGKGHSAANTLLGLVTLAEEVPGTRITWAIRGGSPRSLYGGAAADALPARGLLGARLQEATASGAVTLRSRVSIERLVPGTTSVRVLGTVRDEPLDLEVDAIVDATGFRPDLAMLREVRLDLDPVLEAPRRLAPLIDPTVHSCGSVAPHGADVLAHPDDGFFVVGMKSYGRAPTFLLATGYEQVRSVAAALGQRSRSRSVSDRSTTSVVASASYDGSELSTNRCCSPG